MIKNIKAGADIHAGDGDYSEGTREGYDAFVKIRNKSIVAGRLRDIGFQSGLLSAESNGVDAVELTLAQKKFADLIVRECIGCCEQVISDPVPESVDTWLNGGSQCIDEIKEHFGVEE